MKETKVNLNELRKAIDESGIKLIAIAVGLGISKPTLYEKLNGTREFRWSEVSMISSLLHLSDERFDSIFLR